LPHGDFGDAVEAEVANAVRELGTRIEERPEFLDVRLIFPGGRTCPKPVAALADDPVRRVVATRDPNDEDIATCLDGYRVKGDVRNTGLKTAAGDLLYSIAKKRMVIGTRIGRLTICLLLKSLRFAVPLGRQHPCQPGSFFGLTRSFTKSNVST